MKPLFNQSYNTTLTQLPEATNTNCVIRVSITMFANIPSLQE